MYKEGEKEKIGGSVGQLKVKKEDEIIIKINQEHKNKLETEKKNDTIKNNDNNNDNFRSTFRESVRDSTPTPREPSVPKTKYTNAKLDPIEKQSTPDDKIDTTNLKKSSPDKLNIIDPD